MTTESLRKQILELAETLRRPAHLKDPRAAHGTYVSQIPASSDSPEDLLDHVRLQIKYLLFDLEATRRENTYLRQMLERRSNPGDGPDGL